MADRAGLAAPARPAPAHRGDRRVLARGHRGDLPRLPAVDRAGRLRPAQRLRPARARGVPTRRGPAAPDLSHPGQEGERRRAGSDVEAEVGVDDVAHGLLHVIDLRNAPGGARVGLGHGLAHAVSSIVCTSSAATACAVASFQAIQPSSAHLIRAGYFDTPSNATASSSTSSCSATTASVSPFVRIRVRNASYALVASARSLPTTRSVITETDACEIEQPSES